MLFDLGWNQGRASCFSHGLLESCEDGVALDLGEISQERLALLDFSEVIVEILNMISQVDAEFFDGLAGLNHLLNFFSRKVVLHVGLRWHDPLPNLDHTHSETEWEVNEEDRSSQLEQAKVFKVHEEDVSLGLCFLFSCGILELFCFFLLLLFLQVKFEHVVDLGLLIDRCLLFLLNESVL